MQSASPYFNKIIYNVIIRLYKAPVLVMYVMYVILFNCSHVTMLPAKWPSFDKVGTHMFTEAVQEVYYTCYNSVSSGQNYFKNRI